MRGEARDRLRLLGLVTLAPEDLEGADRLELVPRSGRPRYGRKLEFVYLGSDQGKS